MVIINILKVPGKEIFSQGKWTIVFLSRVWCCWSGCNSEKKPTNPEVPSNRAPMKYQWRLTLPHAGIP